MGTATTSNGILDLFSSDKGETYKGSIEFKQRTISFTGTTLLLSNISKFEQYGLKYAYQITGFLLAFSIIMAIVGLALMPYGLILTVIFGFIAFLGFRERSRPKLYGLTIQLNSGTEHTFLSKDQGGISRLFTLISNAVETNSPMNFNVSFQDKRVIVQNSPGTVVGDNNTFTDNQF